MDEFLTPTMEDYLEVVFNLEKERKVVRVRDIAKSMGVKLPSVTSMLSTLSRKELVSHEKYEYVELTSRGKKIARGVVRNHEIIFNFLKNILHVDPKNADKDACRMEHAVSATTLKKLVEFVKFIQICPRAGTDWIDYFGQYCTHGRSKEECSRHMREFMEKYSAEIN